MVIKKIYTTLIGIICLSSIYSQDTLYSTGTGTGFEIKTAGIISDPSYVNPIIGYNFPKNRINIGIVALNTSKNSRDKILGFNFALDHTILLSKHFDFYLQSGLVFYTENYLKGNHLTFSYMGFNSEEDIGTCNRLLIEIMYGFKYYPSGKWFYLSMDSGVSYNTWEQLPDEKKRIKFPIRLGLGVLLYNRKY